MNVVYTSDVHVDITRNNRSCGLILYEYLKSSNPDLFILAGDISNSIGDIDDFLRLFKSLDIPKVFVQIPEQSFHRFRPEVSSIPAIGFHRSGARFPAFRR